MFLKLFWYILYHLNKYKAIVKTNFEIQARKTKLLCSAYNLGCF